MVGLILVGTAPGGTASNVVAYLSGGNVPLSVSMTFLSTIIAVLISPFLISLYLDQVVEVDRLALFISLLKITFFPLVAGLFVNRFFQKVVKRVEPSLPVVALMSICVIISIIVSINRNSLLDMGLEMLCITSLFILTGFVAGYIGQYFGQFYAAITPKLLMLS